MKYLKNNLIGIIKNHGTEWLILLSEDTIVSPGTRIPSAGSIHMNSGRNYTDTYWGVLGELDAVRLANKAEQTFFLKVYR